jgi:predicted TIM-barrel fold metal-dependent hydrolase
LERLGPGFVGVTQLPAGTSEAEILRLHAIGVRALRFNLKRRAQPNLSGLDGLARRAFDAAGWHAEFYLDATDLPALAGVLGSLPAVCIDHLGLSSAGLPHLLALVERGARVKATGFGRVDFPVARALRTIASIAPDALMFGTDLPGTRSPRPFDFGDLRLLIEALEDESLVRRVLYGNAMALYRPGQE